MLKRLLGLLAAIPLLLAVTPAYAQTAPGGTCGFQEGFATMASMIPNVVGTCVNNQQSSNGQGDTMQETTGGLFTWTKATDVTEFTTGSHTYVFTPPYGLILRDGNTSYAWEGTTSLVAGVAIDGSGRAVDPTTGQPIPTDAHIKVG
ncbi:MAG TPA: hypothetical protein VKU60_09400 [Chloroflexota bacterium]|nr:hypothetical protein [Chloroflexota bacterium]